MFRTALRGDSPRPARSWPPTPIPLEIAVPALRCRGGAELAERLFEPLGWTVEATPCRWTRRFPSGATQPLRRLALTGELRLADALNQLYVLLPVLDDAKHYWVAPDEVDKLLRAGEGWLADAPGAGADHPPLPGPPARR